MKIVLKGQKMRKILDLKIVFELAMQAFGGGDLISLNITWLLMEFQNRL
jgi:hypothetical protein